MENMNWMPFFIFTTVFTLLAIFAAVCAKGMDSNIKELDAISDGKKTDHTVYIPYN